MFFNNKIKKIIIFFINDILLIYYKRKIQNVKEIVNTLNITYKIKPYGEITWFLRI